MSHQNTIKYLKNSTRLIIQIHVNMAEVALGWPWLVKLLACIMGTYGLKVNKTKAAHSV